MKSDFKVKTNFNNNNNNNNNKNNKNNPNDNERKFFTSRDYAFYYNNMGNNEKWREHIEKTRRMVEHCDDILEIEKMTMLNEARFNHKRHQFILKLRKGIYNKEIKIDFNEKWFTQPVILYTDLSKIDLENYKMCGYALKQTDKANVVNFHDLLALERRSAPHMVIQKIVGWNPIIRKMRRKIGDVGCSARGSALYDPDNLRFNRPIMEARDHMRFQNLMDKLSERYTQDEIDNMVCTCVQGKTLCTHLEDCDVINFTHSIYYMDLELINNIIKKGKTIVATLHIFAPGSFTYDFYNGRDHLAKIVKKDNDVNMTIMNDKIYTHKNYFNYLWDRNEVNFKNCSVNVYSRVYHGKFHHIAVVITPYKNINPDYDNDFTFLINSAVKDPKIEYEENLRNILGKDNEIDFANNYNDGKIGFLKMLDIEGKEQRNEDGTLKTTLIRKIKNDFILPKIINTNWLTFKSISQENINAEDYVYVKEELLNSCLKSFTNDDMEKNLSNIIARISSKINTSNTDIIIAIAHYILKAQDKLQHQLTMLKNTEVYKRLENKEYLNYKTKSLLRPIDYIKDTFFNAQIKFKSVFTEKFLNNKRINNLLAKKMYLRLNQFFKKNNSQFKQYKEEQYKKMPKINDPEELRQNIVLNQALEDNQQYIQNVRKETKIIFSDRHKYDKLNINMYTAQDIQNLKNFLQKQLFCDNFILKNYLSEWGIIDHPVKAAETHYNINYNVDYEYLFSKQEVKDFSKRKPEFTNYEYVHNDFDGDRNDCIFYALATAIHREKEDVKKLGKQIKKECLKATINDGLWKDFLHHDMKDLTYLKSLCEFYGIRVLVFNQSDYEQGKIMDIVDELKIKQLNESIDAEYIEELNSYVILLNNNGHLNAIRKKNVGRKLLYGSLRAEREIFRKCINRELYEQYIVNLACQSKDKFACPMYPDLNASTSYEEFIKNVPCYCEGKMAIAHTLEDFDNDDKSIFYTQCPRIQIIASLRQMTVQSQYSPKVKKELEKFMEKFFIERDIDNLIEKYFSEIDYSRWLQRCKPNYRKSIITFLEKTQDWYTIQEPNLVNGVIKEEYQKIGEKARMIGSPTILHKILMGPIESNFENMFKELFPDFWGVGESTNTKEYELNHLIEKYGCDKSVTLDISGLDQSHNPCVKMFWLAICKKVRDFLKKKENSLFNPDHIYQMLTKSSTIILCKDKKSKNYVCITELIDKMASGQGYTTVLNTSLMCFLMEFLRYKYNLILAGKISGDDVALVTIEDQKILSNAFGYLFSSKNVNKVGGCGLILKYFRYGDLSSVSPCSLMSFICPNHGLRLVRQPQRYLSNFFYSQKMLLLPKRLRKTFFNTACIGEQYWAKGYDYFREINEASVELQDVEDMLSILCGRSFHSKGVKKEDKVQKRAELLFMKKGYIINRKFIKSAEYFLLKELNFIRNETKHEQHKIPVYPCCNQALNDHLAEIEPVSIYRTYKDVDFISTAFDSYYEELNKKVSFKNKDNEKYYDFNYREMQDFQKYGITFYRNEAMDLLSFYVAFNKYSKFMAYFKKKINKYKLFLC